jgi:hypothetical protein
LTNSRTPAEPAFDEAAKEDVEWTYAYVAVTVTGARLKVATVSTPALIVGAPHVAKVYVARSTTAGSRLIAKDHRRQAERTLRMRDVERGAPTALGLSGSGILRRASPAASVSSVRADGAKNPLPMDARLVQGPRRTSADIRGLTNVRVTHPVSLRVLLCTEQLGRITGTVRARSLR